METLNKIKTAERILKNYKLIQIQADSAREACEEEVETRITSQLKDIIVSTSSMSDKVGDTACRLASKSKAERKLDIINKFLECLIDKDIEIINRNLFNKETIMDMSNDYKFGLSENTIKRHKKKILENFSSIIFDGDKLNYIFS